MKSKRLTIELNEKSPLAEAYCTLRTNIKFCNSDYSVNLINVTSPGMGDGKSTTCANLALTYAKTGERVKRVLNHFDDFHDLINNDITMTIRLIKLP